jgi:pyruvate-formate lyase-activating enzyme
MRLSDIYKEIKAWGGVKIYGIAYNIDIIDGSCPVSCPSCAVGSIGRRPKAVMSIEFFRKILDKAQAEGKVRNVQLYAYSEPTTHPELHLFVQECTDRGIPAIVSTVLQFSRCDWKKVVEARPVEIRISFPGWKNMNYYQKGARPEVFNKNFEMMMTLPRYPETTWTMGFHVYKDTVDELSEAKALADYNGLKFVALPAIHMANDKNATKDYSIQDKELISRLLEPMEQEIQKYVVSDWCVCYKQVTISATGMTWLCQLTYLNKFQIGPFLDIPLKQLRKRIRTHSFCDSCKQAGGNVYQEKYGYFFEDGDPVAKADAGRLKKSNRTV